MPIFSAMTTPGGFKAGEVASAMQKAIRRCEEEEAVFWATELYIGGWSQYAWKRMVIIASEDVGLADTQTVILVHTLHDAWLYHMKRHPDELRPAANIFVHAVLALARADKSRMVNHLHMLMWWDRHEERFSIPDHALDRHTQRGRAMKRGIDHFSMH